MNAAAQMANIPLAENKTGKHQKKNQADFQDRQDILNSAPKFDATIMDGGEHQDDEYGHHLFCNQGRGCCRIAVH